MTFYAAACQTDFPCPSTRAEIADRTRRMCAMVEQTVVAANQGAQLAHYPPFSWPGGSMVVDYDGRILAQADPGPGEKIIVAQVDVGALREERERRRGHQMLAHLRTEAYSAYGHPVYPGGLIGGAKELSIENNERAIELGRQRLAR